MRTSESTPSPPPAVHVEDHNRPGLNRVNKTDGLCTRNKGLVVNEHTRRIDECDSLLDLLHLRFLFQLPVRLQSAIIS